MSTLVLMLMAALGAATVSADMLATSTISHTLPRNLDYDIDQQMNITESHVVQREAPRSIITIAHADAKYCAMWSETEDGAIISVCQDAATPKRRYRNGTTVFSTSSVDPSACGASQDSDIVEATDSNGAGRSSCRYEGLWILMLLGVLRLLIR